MTRTLLFVSFTFAAVLATGCEGLVRMDSPTVAGPVAAAFLFDDLNEDAVVVFIERRGEERYELYAMSGRGNWSEYLRAAAIDRDNFKQGWTPRAVEVAGERLPQALSELLAKPIDEGRAIVISPRCLDPSIAFSAEALAFSVPSVEVREHGPLLHGLVAR